MARPTEQDTTSAVQRAFSLLDAFSSRDRELTIRQLARVAGIPRSTTHRLARELLEAGLLEQGEAGLRLGVKLFELGSLVPRQADVRDVALPYMHDLGEVTKLTVNLAVRDGGDVLYLEKISSRSVRVPHSRQGGRLPLHATGLGKAILAFSDAETIGAVLTGALSALTDQTMTSSDVLRRELASVRQNHVAFDIGESLPGLFCVAAPILSPRKRAVAAVSVAGAAARSEARRFAPAVRTTAIAVARALYGTTSTPPDRAA